MNMKLGISDLRSPDQFVLEKGLAMRPSKAVKNLIAALSFSLLASTACERSTEVSESTSSSVVETVSAETPSIEPLVIDGNMPLEEAFERLDQEALPVNNVTIIDDFRPTPGLSQIESAFEFQAHYEELFTEAVALNMRGHDLAVELFNMLENEAAYSIPQGPVVTMRMGNNLEEIHNSTFEIVFMPAMYASSMRSPIMTEAGGRTIRIAAEFRTQEWLAIIGLHELSHVNDMVYLGENSFDPQENLMGEVKAHKLERDLIKAWDPQAFEFLVQYGGRYLEQRDINSFYDLASRLYPLSPEILSPREYSLASAGILLAVVFEMVERNGGNDRDLGHAYQEMLRYFGG